MLLQSHPWRISYSSDTHNPVTDFYIPALECAISYDRKAGFFNSSILSAVARGLGAMLQNLQELGTAQNSIRLIMGCQFSPKDLESSTKATNCAKHSNAASIATSRPPPTSPNCTTSASSVG